MDISEIVSSGNMFDGWEVVRLIGEGSYGKVYEIKRERFGVTESTALKHISIPKTTGEIDELMSEGMDEASISSYFRGYMEEFARECMIMSRLKGISYIVSYEDYNIIERKDGIGWDILIRMEMLTPINTYMKNHVLERDEILDLGISMCRALEICKKEKILHRDIKPANIFISEHGDYKLGDFGISRIMSKTTGASTKVGTKDYMAPEIYKDEKYDASVDIYSLGIMLYRFFNNNRLPFLPPAPNPITYSSREEALAKRIRGEVLPMPVNADKDIYNVLAKAAAYNPAARYSDPADMRKDLEMVKMRQPLPVPEYEPTMLLTPMDIAGAVKNDSQHAMEQVQISTPVPAHNTIQNRNEPEVVEDSVTEMVVPVTPNVQAPKSPLPETSSGTKPFKVSNSRGNDLSSIGRLFRDEENTNSDKTDQSTSPYAKSFETSDSSGYDLSSVGRLFRDEENTKSDKTNQSTAPYAKPFEVSNSRGYDLSSIGRVFRDHPEEYGSEKRT